MNAKQARDIARADVIGLIDVNLSTDLMTEWEVIYGEEDARKIYAAADQLMFRLLPRRSKPKPK